MDEYRLEIQTSQEQDALVFSLRGWLDTETSIRASKRLREWLDEGQCRLVGDLSGLEYISSSGLRVMILALKESRAAGGGLCLFGLNPLVKKVFDLAALSNYIPLAEDKEEALEKVGEPA